MTKLAIVHWCDAYFKSGEVVPSDMTEHSLEIVSVGHLIEASEQSIKIAADYCAENGDNGYRELQVIPIEYVKSAIFIDLDSFTKPIRKKRKVRP